jgi:site-specific recombinase XerD
MNSQKETIKNWVPQFVESLREKRRSPATVLAYRADLEQLVAFLSEQKEQLTTHKKVSNLSVTTSLIKNIQQSLFLENLMLLRPFSDG